MPTKDLPLCPLRALVLLVVATGATGCAVQVYLPPTGTAALLERPATVGEGGHAIGAAISEVGALLGPHATSSAVSYTVGLSDATDLAIAPVVHYFGDGRGKIEGYAPGDAFAYGADVRCKTRPFATKHFAIAGGLGGAYHRYATFGTAQVGASLAYENDVLVPFLDLHAYAAVPIAASRFVWRTSATDAPKSLEPSATAGLLASGGLALKIGKAFTLDAAVAYGGAASTTARAPLLGLALGAQYTY